jgi:FMN hydrolase / 5-amino-6-(5-phospho-D-ribitylamino)uracil phosphatase
MLDISRVRAITLDLDDTLWPVWPVIHHAERTLQQWLSGCAPATSALFASETARAELRSMAQTRLPDRLHDLSAIRLEMLRLGLQRCGEDSSLAELAFEVFLAARHEVTLFDDALEGLQWLAARYPVLAVSNGNADVHRLGLGSYFAGSLSARDAGVAKPHAGIFKAASEALGHSPEAVLHVGDDAHLDVLGALDAGMQTVWVNRTQSDWSHGPRPHAVVATMTELCALLQAAA